MGLTRSLVRRLAAVLLVAGCARCGHGGGAAGGDGGASDASLPDARAEGGLDASDAGPVITGMMITQNPNSVLSATLTFTTSEPAIGQAHIANAGAADNTLDSPAEGALTTSHSIALLGMRAQSSFAITATATDAGGHASSATATYSTPALPPWLPPITVVMNDKTQTSPGYTLLSLQEFTGTPVSTAGTVGIGLVAVDSDFQIVWYQQPGALDVEKVPSGSLVHATALGGWEAVDMMGNVQLGASPASLGVAFLTHAFQPEADGNALAISLFLQEVGGYPAPDGGTQADQVVGDQLVEVPPDGGPAKVLADTFDFFDPHREGTTFNNNEWNPSFPDAGGTKDWIHGNAVVPDPSDGTLVASAPSQNWIYKVTRQGQLVWRLGFQGDFTLTNPDTDPPEASWQYYQHGSYVTPSGTIMCLDDGAGRPFVTGCSTADAGNQGCYYSRAVEFSFDTTGMTATRVWQYGSPTYGDPDNIDSQIFGSAYVLPGQVGPTVLVNDGCEVADRTTSIISPDNLKWARIIEVTYTTPPVRVAEFDVKVGLGGYPPDPTFSGFGVYRAYRLPSLYAGSVGSADEGDR